jgi:hypothetical protein
MIPRGSGPSSLFVRSIEAAACNILDLGEATEAVPH